MDFSEKWGDSIEAAVQLALDDLNLTRDENHRLTKEDVDVTVLEEPSRGFFGIGSKLAKVRVDVKKAAPAPQPEKKPERAERPSKPVKQEQAVEKTRPERERNPKRDTHKKRKEKPSPKFDLENIEPIIAKEPEENLTPCENHIALTFLAEVTKEMGLELDITAKEGKDVLYIDIQGKDSGTIIGKRGQTLDAIQYLTSLVVNKEQNAYTRVVVDAENYRAKREKTLELLATRLASKVVRTKKSVRLEPMNPYERKVIHATLQNHPRVTTRSEGQDPYRRVIIELK